MNYEISNLILAVGHLPRLSYYLFDKTIQKLLGPMRHVPPGPLSLLELRMTISMISESVKTEQFLTLLAS